MKNRSNETNEIQGRFFQALEWCISSGKLSGLQSFCDDHGLCRSKYSRIRNNADGLYKCIDIDALSHICRDYGINPAWLLLGKGKMT